MAMKKASRTAWSHLVPTEHMVNRWSKATEGDQISVLDGTAWYETGLEVARSEGFEPPTPGSEAL